MPMNAANLIQASVRSTTGFGDVAGYTPVSQSTIDNPSSEGFAGTMYLDDVQITPP